MSILVFGSLNSDFTNYVERFPRPGESVRGEKFALSCGGKGANQAVAAAKLNARVQFVGMVGDDAFAQSCIDNLKRWNVETKLIKRVENTSTGVASITVDKHGENCIVIVFGANEHLSPKRAREVESAIADAALVVCQREVKDAAVLEAFKIARAHKTRTLWNPAPASADLDRDILRFTDIVCANETEAQILTEKKLESLEDYKTAAKQLLSMGPQMAIITLGSKGAILAENRDDQTTLAHIEPPERVEVVETSGAGDCFCGTLAHLLTAGATSEVAVRKAVHVASLSVTRSGINFFTLDELKQRKVF